MQCVQLNLGVGLLVIGILGRFKPSGISGRANSLRVAGVLSSLSRVVVPNRKLVTVSDDGGNTGAWASRRAKLAGRLAS